MTYHRKSQSFVKEITQLEQKEEDSDREKYKY